MEGDGGVGLGDTVDVGGDVWAIHNRACGVDDGDGKLVSVVL